MRKLTDNRIIKVNDIEIGGSKKIIMAGPCAVESKEQILTIAKAIANGGGHILRGGVFKPRTSPFDFQGLGEEGLEYLYLAGKETGLPIVTELMEEKYLPLFMEKVDIIQVGSRNMYNYPLLKALGKIDKPILLKRGMTATIKEWIMAAEYIASEGNCNIILCERGIRGFDDYTRNILDLSAVPIMKNETGLPVIVDPSHGTGIRELVSPMSKASIAAGCDGLMLEVHTEPDKSVSDAKQTISIESFNQILSEI